MASGISPGCWRVKIMYLPATITNDQLAQTFNLSNSRITIPKKQQFATYFAWIDGFVSEEDARDFVNQWSGSSIFGTAIKCNAFGPQSNDTPVCHALSNLTISDVKTHEPKPSPSKQFGTHSGSGFNGNQNSPSSSGLRAPLMFPKTTRPPNSPQLFNQHRNQTPQHPPSNPGFLQLQGSSSSVVKRLVNNQDVEDKRPLCRYANKGTCGKKSNECKYRHQRCWNFEACSDLNCDLAHAKRETVPKPYPFVSHINSGLPSDPEEKEQDSRMPYSIGPRRDFHSSISSTQSIIIKTKTCCNGIECFKVDCEFNHPDGWNPCTDGAECENYECTANHPFKRKVKCRDGNRCETSNCKFLHPNTHAKECSLCAKCKEWNCSKIHPRSRARPCTDKENCTNLACLCLHPPERAKLLCSIGAECRDLSCKFNHPSERPPICDQINTCSNFNCIRLHVLDWNPCEAGDNCEDGHCSKIHPPEYIINLKEKTTAATATNNERKYRKAEKYLKSLVQRMKDWQKAQLPILSRRSEYACTKAKTGFETVLMVFRYCKNN